ncbi:MAG: SRPBCC family protein [Parvularculaceae bacterium]
MADAGRGAARRLTLADGHYVIERVLENRPDFFKYQVWVFTNAAGRGVDQIVGEQRFTETADGVTFEWTYNIKPKNALTRIFVRRVANRDIRPFLQNGIDGFAAAARDRVDAAAE